MTKRGLSEEDIAIWQQITRRIERLNPDREATVIVPKKSPPLKKVDAKPAPAITPFRIGEAAKPVKQAPNIVGQPTDRSPNMDRKNFQRLLKGKFEIDATLDLHGMTADQAKVQMIQFISNAHRQGFRLVLVITGKGKRTHTDTFNRERGGVLRQSLPDWVRSSAITDKILQVTQAQPKHGGGGAFYVYLRRKRMG
ncbi:MAG: Smr/MutS family protein [Pseudomonadota bacterium]